MSDISCTLLDCMMHDCPPSAWLHVVCLCGPHIYPLTSNSLGFGHSFHPGSHYCKCETFCVFALWPSQRLGVGSSDGLYWCTGAFWRRGTGLVLLRSIRLAWEGEIPKLLEENLLEKERAEEESSRRWVLGWVSCSIWFIFFSSLSHFGLFCIAHQFGLDYMLNFIDFLDHFLVVDCWPCWLSLWFGLKLIALYFSYIL